MARKSKKELIQRLAEEFLRENGRTAKWCEMRQRLGGVGLYETLNRLYAPWRHAKDKELEEKRILEQSIEMRTLPDELVSGLTKCWSLSIANIQEEIAAAYEIKKASFLASIENLNTEVNELNSAIDTLEQEAANSQSEFRRIKKTLNKKYQSRTER